MFLYAAWPQFPHELVCISTCAFPSLLLVLA